MSPTVLEARTSLLFAGVTSRSVRTFSPAGTTVVVAYCVRKGEPLHAEGADVADALTKLATKAGLVAMLEREERRLCEAAS